MNAERYKIYLAALLHDIGKFAFRAQEIEAGEGHEVLGENFIREHLSKIAAIGKDAENIAKYSKQHGNKSYCHIADQITAAERIQEPNTTTFRPLVSVFQNIFRKVSGNNVYPVYYKPNKIYYYKPYPVTVDNTEYQTDGSASEISEWKYDKNKSIELHSKLYEIFKDELQKLNNTKHLESFASSLYYLLHKYTARISSASYKSLPDISLFDHGRTTAAVVNCLTLLLNENDIQNYDSQKTQPRFLLLKGDLAGIQNFIYSDISPDVAGDTKGLAKRLRGRSFYVALLSDFIASLFVRELQLAEANILYSGGGHFLLVAPFAENVVQKIDHLEREVNLMLHDKLYSRLTFITSLPKGETAQPTWKDRAEKISFGQDLFNNAANALYKVNYELNQNKYKKHLSYLSDVIAKELEPEIFNDDSKVGANLPYAAYLLEIISDNPGDLLKSKSLVTSFDKFHTYYFIVEKPVKGTPIDAIKELLDPHQNNIRSARLFKLNDTDFLEYAEELTSRYRFPVSFGFRFVGIAAPKDKKGDVLSFEELACLDRENNNKLSYPQLGILRLDVDNLGAIFAYGLDQHSTSFSRIATLSRELHFFFCGYVNKLAEEHHIYIAYSGGDDAFFIGSWINILHFTRKFRDEFKKFTCENPNITFSAGIFTCDSHFPVARFAEAALDMEKKSKKFNNNNKNAITVFDHTLSWDAYDNMLNFAELLLRNTKTSEGEKNKKLSRSLIHRLLRIIKASVFSHGPNHGKVDIDKLERNVMQLHYLFARHGYTKSEIEQTQNELHSEIIKVILTNFSKKELVKNYIIPTQYVLLKTRTLEKNQKK